jgi:hypothetical protein
MGRRTRTGGLAVCPAAQQAPWHQGPETADLNHPLCISSGHSNLTPGDLTPAKAHLFSLRTCLLVFCIGASINRNFGSAVQLLFQILGGLESMLKDSAGHFISLYDRPRRSLPSSGAIMVRFCR